MKTKLIVIGLAAILAAGCKTSSKELNKVHLGMPEAEVVKILGEPESQAETKTAAKLFSIPSPRNLLAMCRIR